MKYKVNHKGATTGAVSGKYIAYQKDVVVECEKDDLKHLGDDVSQVEEEKKSSKKSTKKASVKVDVSA